MLYQAYHGAKIFFNCRGIVIFNGGDFHGKIIVTDYMVINGGSFDGEISLKRENVYANNVVIGIAEGKLLVNNDYDKTLNIVSDSESYTFAVIDEGGYTVYQTKVIE